MIISIYRKYKEIINYIIYGGLTTVVNFVIYYGCIDYIKIHYIISNVIAWFFSVLFAYITNRLYVFTKVNFTIKDVAREVTLFFSSRFVSGFIETLLLFFMVDASKMSNQIAKVVVAIVVVILNYVFSKLIVFKKYK